MTNTIFDFTPFLPGDSALTSSALPDLAMRLGQTSAKLSGQLSAHSHATLETYMRVINSYYSNLIEGNATRPHEIRAAQRGDYSTDAAKRDLQLESLGHMAVQTWLAELSPSLDEIFTPGFIQEVHRQFYQHIPESLWEIKNEQDDIAETVVPGRWRSSSVTVGVHVPPDANQIPAIMERFCETYQSNRFKGDRKLIAIMAAHHRFLWVHPFLDGNGRVGRLLTDAALKASGLDSYGVWCLSRGLAYKHAEYKRHLALADQVRQGDLDGRGQLSEKNLLAFAEFMLTTAIDQVEYIRGLLELPQLRRRIDGYIQARNDGRVMGMQKELKPIAGLILHTAFVYGEIERAQALELCAMPERSARRLLSQLKSEGLLSETSSKSPLRWEVPEHAEPWYFPNLAPQG